MNNNQYEDFFNFLGSWFPDMDYDGLTEVDVVKNFQSTINEKALKEIIKQGKDIEVNISNYWEEVKNETNLYFEDENETKIWLNNIIMLLEKR